MTVQVCSRCHGVDPFAEGVSELRKRCSPLTCDAWAFRARLTKQGPKPLRPDGRADLGLVSEAENSHETPESDRGDGRRDDVKGCA